ncbi:MAG: hypothetical protein ACTSRZ_07215 [Promethearchaeota archaeon]
MTSILEFDEFWNLIKKKMPKNVHEKIDFIKQKTISLKNYLNKDQFTSLIEHNIMKIVKDLENNNINPINAMRKIQEFDNWLNLFYEKKENLKFILPETIKEDVLKKIFDIYRISSSGRKISIEELINLALKDNIENKSSESYEIFEFASEYEDIEEFDSNYENIESFNENNDYIAFRSDSNKSKKDGINNRQTKNIQNIKVSNISVTIREILIDIENKVFEIFDKESYRMFLENGEIHKFDLNTINIDCKWAQNRLKSGESAIVSIRKEIEEKKREIKWSLEIYKLLKPLLEESHFIISLIPILMTMLYNEQNNSELDKIRELCDKIFTEFSMGATLERLAFSLKEKFLKNREISEIEIIAKQIKKEFKKIEDALNFQVISQLRRMKLQTIIEDEFFLKAKEYGIDLHGLKSKFGVVKVPVQFKELKLSAFKIFDGKINKIISILKNKIKEEINPKYNPNLHDLKNLISEIASRIEDDNINISDHITPLFILRLEKLNKILDDLIKWIEPLKKNTLNYLINKYGNKKPFYDKLKEIYDPIQFNFELYKDTIDFASKIALADQALALKISTMDFTEEEYNNGFKEDFKRDRMRLIEMKNLKSITDFELKNSQIKIRKAEQAVEEFIKKYPYIWFKNQY